MYLFRSNLSQVIIITSIVSTKNPAWLSGQFCLLKNHICVRIVICKECSKNDYSIAYASMMAQQHIVYRFVSSFIVVRHPASLCECNTSEVFGSIAFIFSRTIDHEVLIISHFVSMNFVRIMIHPFLSILATQ